MDAHINSLYLKKPYQLLGLIVLFSLFLVLPLAGIYEWTGIEMSKDIQTLFNAIMQKPFGIVAVAILAPIVEEIVFRGAILRLLLECFSGKKDGLPLLFRQLLLVCSMAIWRKQLTLRSLV